MVIKSLKPSQRVQGRWLAQLEDGSLLRLGENEVLHFSLYAGRELTDGEAEALMRSAERNARRERALNLAAEKPLSRRELERKLAQWGAGEEEQAAVCDRLEELGLLNDGEYARLVVRHYSAKGYGEKFSTSFSPRRRREPSSSWASHRPWTRWEGFRVLMTMAGYSSPSSKSSADTSTARPAARAAACPCLDSSLKEF